MEQFKDREKRKYNEMSEREKLINLKPLYAFESMENGNAYNSMLPGYNKFEIKDNYRRFHKKGFNQNVLGNHGVDAEYLSMLDNNGSQ